MAQSMCLELCANRKAHKTLADTSTLTRQVQHASGACAFQPPRFVDMDDRRAEGVRRRRGPTSQRSWWPAAVLAEVST